jgi:cell wall-associated NlpC family hydrolase
VSVARVLHVTAVLLAACLAAVGCAKTPVSTKPVVVVAPAPEDRGGLTADPGREAARLAKSMLGVGYVFGGEDPEEGFDCSGLAWWAYDSLGVEIPRASWEQAKAGSRVDRYALRAGDLLFFRTRPGKSLHVGVYLGDGRFVHSPKSGAVVRLDELDNGYWARTFLQARRVAEPWDAGG